MSPTTIVKRDSENFMQANFSPNRPAVSPADATAKLQKRDSKKGTAVKRDTKSAHRSQVDRTSDLIAAWGDGRFNSGDDAAYEEFFTQDVVVDASAAVHSGVAAFKTYHGFDGAKEWFAWGSCFELEGVDIAHVAAPIESEVWLRFEVAHDVCKKTGKGGAYHAIAVFSWVGDKCAKIVNVPYQPARIAAICSEQDVPIPPMAALPPFEPHPAPMEVYEKIMQMWGANELSSPDVCKMYVAPDAVNDVSDSTMPDVLKVYEGVTGSLEWMDYMATHWELSNIDVKPVAGLKPGCVMHRFTCDVKHKTSGKEAAKGWQVYTELAYNVQGQFVYSRNYFVNATLLASIY